jgi:peptide/nickel transport system permease protein
VSMNVPPPEPSSAAATVEVAAEEAAFEELGEEVDAGAAPIDMRAERRQARRERRKLLLRRPGFLVGALILLVWIVCAIGGERITPYSPFDPEFPPFRPPNTTNWFGTDQLGRDVLSRVMAGARDVLIAAPIAAVISVVAGTLLGLIMGYYRGWIDEILSRLVEALLSIPVFVMAILIATSLGVSRITLIGTVAVLFTPIVTRTARAAVIAEAQLDYVVSAKLRGESGLFVMTREILPNVSGPIIVELTVRIGYAVFTIATLSFLGFGLQRPSPDWGLQVADTYEFIQSGYWWPAIFPALAIASLVFATTLVADSIEAVLAA